MNKASIRNILYQIPVSHRAGLSATLFRQVKLTAQRLSLVVAMSADMMIRKSGDDGQCRSSNLETRNSRVARDCRRMIVEDFESLLGKGCRPGWDQKSSKKLSLSYESRTVRRQPTLRTNREGKSSGLEMQLPATHQFRFVRQSNSE